MDERTGLRKFSEKPPESLRHDVDTGDHLVRMGALIAGVLGFVLGSLLGVFIIAKGGPTWVGLLCAPLGAVALGALTRAVVSGSVKTAGTIYNPSGATTPHKREHSQAESFVARGRYQEAVDAFEMAVMEDPTDPWPYLRVARIYRDHLARPEDAARWFRRAFREAHGTPVLARKELVELYVHRMNAPAKAAPELARMAEELVGTPEGEWAAAELRHVKELMLRERE